MNTAADVGAKAPASWRIGRGTLLQLVEASLDPFALVASLWAAAYGVQGRIDPIYLALALIVFSVTFPGNLHLRDSYPMLMRRIAIGWVSVAGLLLFFGYATGYIGNFDSAIILTWLWAAPLSQFGAHAVLRTSTPWLLQIQGDPRRVAIAGRNEQGLALAAQIRDDPCSDMKIVGFFDDRHSARLNGADPMPSLGNLENLPQRVAELHIDVLYLSLPMTTQPRILHLLDALRDTTTSVYFVPDIFVTDLIQSRVLLVGRMPVVAVCETPFDGINGLVKRVSDLVLAALILLLISPCMLAAAIGVKLSSPGPVIFKQRRYGLAGEEITVYKFRSMTVCEDGEAIAQATRNDPRITPFGAFLRKTSIDELPQFINVLQGRMSIVGPRPHAVAHNEMYRKLIKGYMVRHKVKPGITGWAQVNGLRGETESLEKMKARIEYDLDYLRNWSLWLDLRIILRTIAVVVKDRNAY